METGGGWGCLRCVHHIPLQHRGSPDFPPLPVGHPLSNPQAFSCILGGRRRTHRKPTGNDEKQPISMTPQSLHLPRFGPDSRRFWHPPETDEKALRQIDGLLVQVQPGEPQGASDCGNVCRRHFHFGVKLFAPTGSPTFFASLKGSFDGQRMARFRGWLACFLRPVRVRRLLP